MSKRAKVVEGGVVGVLDRVAQRINELQFAMEATRKDMIELQRRTEIGVRVVDPAGGQTVAATSVRVVGEGEFKAAGGFKAVGGQEEAQSPRSGRDDLPRLLNPEERVEAHGIEGGGVGIAVPIDRDWESTHRVLGRVNGSPVVLTVKLDSSYRGSDPKRRLARITVTELEQWPAP